MRILIPQIATPNELLTLLALCLNILNMDLSGLPQFTVDAIRPETAEIGTVLIATSRTSAVFGTITVPCTVPVDAR